MKADLLLKNGTLVIPAVGLVEADVLVENGKVKAIGEGFEPGVAAEEVDLTGLHLMPGLIDPHVHLGLFNDFEQDCATETEGALCGGVTTIGIFFGKQEPYEDLLPGVWKQAEANIKSDVFFHLFLLNTQHVENLERYYHEFGVRSFKAYMASVPNVVNHLNDGLLFEAMLRASTMENPPVMCVHAENEDMINRATERILKEYEDVPLERWSDTHPNFAEEEAVRRAVNFSNETGVELYCVHLSTGEAASILPEVCSPKLFTETIVPYLTCARTEDFGYLGKMLPPLRDHKDIDALWEGIRSGHIHCIGTDHISIMKDKKLKNLNMKDVIPAGPSIDTSLPSCLTEGYYKRQIDLVSLIEKMTLNPARIFGLYPQKGSIVVGGDADFVAVDLAREKVVKAEELASVSDFSFHEGRKLKGWPVYTFKAGRLVARDGQLVEVPKGQILNKNRIT